MNILKFRILSTRQLEAMMADVAAAKRDDEEDDGQLESAKFAKTYGRGAAKEMLEMLARNTKDAERNSKIALYLSIPHQMGFLLGLVPFKLNSLSGVLSAITLFGMAMGLPYLTDRLILMCIRQISTRVVKTRDKIKAFGVLVPAIAVSGYLNIMAPGPQLLKWVAGLVVLMVPFYQVVRSARPDFRKAGAEEVANRGDIAALVDPLAVARTAEAQAAEAKAAALAAKKAATKKANRSAAMKVAWETRRARLAQAAAEAEAAKLAAEAKRTHRRKPVAAATHEFATAKK